MALLAAGMMLRGASLDEAFLVGVSVAVAAVPEGLAATVTIALAQGARAMAARGAIVRRLSAVETLGSASVIATDKTGTLTLNQLRIVDIEPVRGFCRRDVLELGVLASTAELVDGRAARHHRRGPRRRCLSARREGGRPARRATDSRPPVGAGASIRPRPETPDGCLRGRRAQRVAVKGAFETLFDLSSLDLHRTPPPRGCGRRSGRDAGCECLRSRGERFNPESSSTTPSTHRCRAWASSHSRIRSVPQRRPLSRPLAAPAFRLRC